jgi:integrase
VPWASFHTLRHSYGSMLFRAGASAKQVQACLGHASPQFTLSVYVHLLPDVAFLDRLRHIWETEGNQTCRDEPMQRHAIRVEYR